MSSSLAMCIIVAVTLSATVGPVDGLADECSDPTSALPDALRARFVSAAELLGEDDPESAADYIELMLMKAPESVAVLDIGVRAYRALDDEERAAELEETLRVICPEHEFESAAAPATGPLADARNAYRAFLDGSSSSNRKALLATAIDAYDALLGTGDPAHEVESHQALAALYVYAGRARVARDEYAWLGEHDALDANSAVEYLRALRGIVSEGGDASIWKDAGSVMSEWRSRFDAKQRAIAERHAGFIALRLDRYDEARTAFEAALARDANDRESHFGLASIYYRDVQLLEQSGKSAAAKELRQQALVHARAAVSHPRYGDAAQSLVKRLEFSG